MPPRGLAAKPTAYVENARSTPAVSENSGKNSAGKTSEAAVPYKKKSYHSMAVPIKLAKATFRISPCDGAAPLLMPTTPRPQTIAQDNPLCGSPVPCRKLRARRDAGQTGFAGLL